MSEVIGEGFGRILAEAREAKGWSIAEVGDKLKLTSRQVEALETEDLSALPAAVFVRGFARNYARLLGLPADNLPGLSVTATEPASAISAPSEDLVFRTSSVRRWILLPMIGLIVFLALVAALYNWLRQGEDAYLTSEVQSQVVTAPLPPPQIAPAQMTPTQDAQPATVIETVPLPLPVQPQPSAPPTVAAPEGNAAVATPPATTPPAAVPPSAPAKPQPAAPAKTESDSGTGTDHTVHLAVQDEDAWIEIVSADQKHTSRLLRAGEQMTVQGVPPLKVVVGNAAHVRLNYDAKSVDLQPYIGEKVARLTLE